MSGRFKKTGFTIDRFTLVIANSRGALIIQHFLWITYYWVDGIKRARPANHSRALLCGLYHPKVTLLGWKYSNLRTSRSRTARSTKLSHITHFLYTIGRGN